jgi:hypothetical protein
MVLSWDNPEDRVAIVRMNAELRHAQLELLSAECAAQQLRLRYSSEDIARFAERDVLQKAMTSAGALNHYFASIPKHAPAAAPTEPAAGTPKLNGDQILEAIGCLSGYLREQRNAYFPAAASLRIQQRNMMQPFFSTGLLDRTRIVQLNGARIALPAFYEKARSCGFDKLPDLQHMASMTFLDVVVFNEKMTERELFHGLVHAVQFAILGVELYCDLFIRAFLRTNAHFTVPLEAHAFALDSKFAQNRDEGFSVEGQVRLWAKESRY